MNILTITLMGLSAILMSSCTSTCIVESSGLIMDSNKEVITLNGKILSDNEFEKFLEDPSNENLSIAIVEGNEVEVSTVKEVNETISAIFSIFFRSRK